MKRYLVPARSLVKVRHSVFLALLLVFPAAHAENEGHRQKTGEKKSKSTYVAVGYASWYGKKFHGRKTASGETFDMHKMTAAHRSLPFNTYVKVTNLANDKSVVVRINDRGPFTKNRIIDLSYAAAKEIGMIEKGVAKVKIEEVRGQPAEDAN